MVDSTGTHRGSHVTTSAAIPKGTNRTIDEEVMAVLHVASKYGGESDDFRGHNNTEALSMSKFIKTKISEVKADSRY